jgi:TolA-binding protein
MNLGLAIIPVATAADIEAQQKRNTETQAKPVIQGLAAHVKKRWESAREAKRTIEERMLQGLRQRNGQYDPDIEAEIKKQGGSDIYINLSSVKCRAATSWLRDTLLGTGADKPWGLEPTPEATLPPEVIQALQAKMAQQLMMIMEAGQTPPDPEQLRQVALQMKDSMMREMQEEAQQRVDRMERKMEDQLVEGGWIKALNEFLDDIVTFPFAVLKGPVKRKRKTLKWANGKLVPAEEIRNEWERVDPFLFYWAPWSSDVNDGFIIERHKLTREDLQALLGVPGYNDDAIRAVLQDFDQGSLNEWLWTDSAQSVAEGKDTTQTIFTTDLIEALQLWDSVEGKVLREWGLSNKEIPDPTLTYPCEVWLIGNTVIRAVLNYDQLGRKPYYVTSYEKVPGAIAGKGVTDLCRDSQAMVNASARSLANNMGISSGPQVGVNVSRLPPGEDITEMYPWKIWQFQSSEFNDGSQPLSFFQPGSNANELMAVFEKFSARADEDTMIPRYMTGESSPGAGRTSSGLSMLISNAGKGIKQVITNIDQNVIVPCIERLYQDNLRYAQDPDLVGDVRAVARGATSLVVKEAEAVRRNEFLTLVLNSPVAQQIVGMDGAAELLREQARNLAGNVDRIVPNRPTVSAMQQLQQQNMQLQQQIEAMMGAAQEVLNAPAGGMTQGPAPKNMLPDGSQVGGREGNFVSPRPNMR